MMRIRSLRHLVSVSLFTGAVIIFATTTAVATSLYERLVAEQARDAAADQAAVSARRAEDLIRGEGWSLERVEAHLRRSLGGTEADTDLTLHAAGAVAAGTAGSRAPGPSLAEVLDRGGMAETVHDGGIWHLIPIATNGAAPGAVLELRQAFQPVPPGVRMENITLFGLFTGLAFVCAAGTGYFTIRYLERPVDALRRQVEKVNSVDDLARLDLGEVDFGFDELNRVYEPFDTLVERMRSVAVDREVLEFEIRLLGKFIITSEVVRDWHTYVQTLLLEINEIVDACALVTIFRIGEEAYEVDIFWYRQPTESSRQALLHVIHERLAAQFHDEVLPDMRVEQYVADPQGELPELDQAQLEFETKSLILETPKIGGVAGIAVQSNLASDPIRYMVVESILTTLVNLVGSVKAIYQYTQDLEYYATRDPATGLYNQRVFWDLLHYEVLRASRHEHGFAVMVVDIDNFKSVNDRYGHDFGDQFLRQVTAVVRDNVRTGDILARYGGDEIVMILPEADAGQAWAVARGLRGADAPITADDGTVLRPTFSIGIAIFPDHGQDARELFTVADSLMYRAKASGKDQAKLPTQEDVTEILRESSEKAHMVLSALEEQRLVPFFQPIADVRTGGIHTHEVLMRIEHEGRLVTAGQFVEMAERMGVIHRLDYQLIEKAFHEIVRQGYEDLIFLNLSPKALVVSEFLHRIRQFASDSGIAPDRVVLEITERDTVQNMALLEQFVTELKGEGFRFAIDDFGSGFSSFHYVKRLPIDFVKIEGEFVRNILTSREDAAMIQSIATLARGLNIMTVAEHVEDPAIVEALRSYGIDYAQGFHIGRPGPDLIRRG